jgi:peptidoglycan/LPS O-acetylase OafA/YrhL
MVMAFHFVGHNQEPLWFRKLMIFGITGVDLFFVLSGFLITRILLYSKGSKVFFRSFYMRRTLRIFPLYYGFLTIYFFVLPFLFSTPIPSWSTQSWSWLYLANIPSTFSSISHSGPAHFWSLAVEEHFYLIWPLVVYLCTRRQLYVITLSILALSPMIRAGFLAYDIGVYNLSITRFDSIVFGALLSLWSTESQTFNTKKLVFGFRALLIFLPLVLIPLFVQFSGSRSDWLQIFKFTFIPAFYFSLLGFCLFDPKALWFNRVLSQKHLRNLGKISYGVYVFHPTCYEIVEKFIAPPWAVVEWICSFALTVGVAHLSFTLFESPLLKLKERFQYLPPSAKEETCSSPNFIQLPTSSRDMISKSDEAQATRHNEHTKL